MLATNDFRVSAARPVVAATAAPARRKPLGQILLERRFVDPGDLVKAVAMRARQEARLGDILLSRGWVGEGNLMRALAEQWSAELVPLDRAHADVRLVDQVGTRFCLAHAVLPWRKLGGATVIATARPEEFATISAALPPSLAPFVMALASERAIQQALAEMRQTALIRRAETQVPARESCRNFRAQPVAIICFIAATLGLALLMPALLFRVTFAWAVLTLIASGALKLAALIAMTAQKSPPPDPPSSGLAARLPVVSVMIPLLHENDVAGRLIARIKRLDYPRELLDAILVVEETDALTRATLRTTHLPGWIRVVTVPRGPVRTKPRALNYALNFCRGSIIGVYDAEDAPEADQIHKVVRHFRKAPPEVACVQGILDFYNAQRNWLSRCFAIEYAGWFRVVLPGLARLGLIVPLGGTTLFFRRHILEELGGWDAHNVTEDADLGLRLARHGYRTDLIETVTDEEPNARVLPWIRQRSRWIKGYGITWLVHMRQPGRLWREVGPLRFLGVQVLFLGSLSQALLAPVLWSTWLLALGLRGPEALGLPVGLAAALGFVFVLSEVINLAVGFRATATARHRPLRLWVPTLYFYYPLATFAAYKAAWEFLTRPFYWDKTAHGMIDESSDAAAEPEIGSSAADAAVTPAPPTGLGSQQADAGESPYAPFFLTKSVARKVRRARTMPVPPPRPTATIILFPHRQSGPFVLRNPVVVPRS